MAQRLRRAPVFPKPAQRVRVFRAEPQHSRRHRQQRVQVERAGPAGADARNRQIVASADGLAQPAGDDAGTGDAQRAWLPRRRDQEVEHILLDPIEVELPGNDPGPGRSLPERGQHGVRPGDRETVMQPVGVIEPQRSGARGVRFLAPARRRRRTRAVIPPRRRVGRRRGLGAGRSRPGRIRRRLGSGGQRPLLAVQPVQQGIRRCGNSRRGSSRQGAALPVRVDLP